LTCKTCGADLQRLLPLADNASIQVADHSAVIPPSMRFRFERLVTKVVQTLASEIVFPSL